MMSGLGLLTIGFKIQQKQVPRKKRQLMILVLFQNVYLKLFSCFCLMLIRNLQVSSSSLKLGQLKFRTSHVPQSSSKISKTRYPWIDAFIEHYTATKGLFHFVEGIIPNPVGHHSKNALLDRLNVLFVIVTVEVAIANVSFVKLFLKIKLQL